ncbi:TPA: hypothetical protein MEH70_005548 [Klebsiella pneumoniae]|nr:hypothetical protein [Klebsiella pneumoniae]
MFAGKKSAQIREILISESAWEDMICLFAPSLGLGILLRKYEQFRQELDAAGELGNWEYDLDTYNHCIAVLQRYFTGNPSGLTERDARIYSHYLQTEHKRFVKLAEELAAGR